MNILVERKRELILYFVFIPLLLIFFFVLPDSIKELFILNRENPSLLSFYFSSFVHSNLDHFLHNLAYYLISIFLIINIETNRKRLYVFTVLIFILMPFATSFLFFKILPEKIKFSQGFSDIVSAFIGYLLFCVFSYLKEKWYKKLSYNFLWFLLILNILILCTMNYFLTPVYFIALFGFLISIPLSIGDVKKIIKMGLAKIAEYKKYNLRVKAYELMIFSLTFPFVFYLPVLIPSKITYEGVVINIVSHYVGYALGVFIPFILDLALTRRET